MRKTIPLAFQYAHEADPDSWRNDWPMAGRNYYIYFGGLWGGQLQRYRNNKALESAILPEGTEEALPTRVARLREDMMEFAEEPRAVVIIDENGKPLTAGDTAAVFLKLRGCTSITGDIISLILREIPICFVMR